MGRWAGCERGDRWGAKGEIGGGAKGEMGGALAGGGCVQHEKTKGWHRKSILKGILF